MAQRTRRRSLVAPERGGKRERATESRAVGMREMELSAEEARELRGRIAHPRALPTRSPRDLPPADASLIR
jgi:hypothetical protein